MSEQGPGSVLTGNPAGGQDAAAGNTSQQPAGQGQQPGAFDWKSTLGESYTQHEAMLTAKGWKNPADVVTGYASLEKLLGADKAGRAVVLPGDDAPPEAWNAVFDKLGRPKTADDYKLPVPDGVDPTFAKAAAAEFHKLGVPAKQATALATWWNGQQQAAVEAQQAKINTDFAALTKEWGPQAQANRHAIVAAAKHYGLDEPTMAGLEAALGVGPTAKLLLRLAGENKLVGDGLVGRGGPGFGGTASDAQGELDRLKKDPEFQQAIAQRHHPKHDESVRRLNELSERARPNAVAAMGGMVPAPA